MDYIDVPNGMRHVLASATERGQHGKGKTLCGKSVGGQTGGCIAPMIECKICRRMLRADGWQV